MPFPHYKKNKHSSKNIWKIQKRLRNISNNHWHFFYLAQGPGGGCLPGKCWPEILWVCTEHILGSGLVAFARFSKGQSPVLELPTYSASPVVFCCVHITFVSVSDTSRGDWPGYVTASNPWSDTLPRPLSCPVADAHLSLGSWSQWDSFQSWANPGTQPSGGLPQNFETIYPSQQIVFIWAIQAEIPLGGILGVMVDDSVHLLFPQEGTPARSLRKPPQNVLPVLALEFGDQLSSITSQASRLLLSNRNTPILEEGLPSIFWKGTDRTQFSLRGLNGFCHNYSALRL